MHLPFSVVLGKNYFIYCKENLKHHIFHPKQTKERNQTWISIYFFHTKYFDGVPHV